MTVNHAHRYGSEITFKPESSMVSGTTRALPTPAAKKVAGIRGVGEVGLGVGSDAR